MMAGMLLAPVLVVVLIVLAYVALRGGSNQSQAGRNASRPSSPAVGKSSAATAAPQTLGPWKHIVSRAVDPQPLSVAELYPMKLSAGGVAANQTNNDLGTNCVHDVIGSALRAALHSAGCTQVVRASYLSTDGKLMATIGVANLVDVTAAKRVGRASGSSEFIKQLPGDHGPTRKLGKGTGLEEADVMGHYLILTWVEFANLHQPSSHHQVAELKAFSTGLITGTANVSLASRMATGKPATP